MSLKVLVKEKHFFVFRYFRLMLGFYVTMLGILFDTKATYAFSLFVLI